MPASIKAIYYCSNQASNQLICAELCSTLINRGHSVTVVAEDGFTHLHHLQDEVKYQHLQLKGNKQHDLHLKPKQGTALVDSEAAWLRAQKADVVICGAVPFGCSAAAAAGICAVCIANSTGGEVTVRHTLQLILESQPSHAFAGCLLQIAAAAMGSKNVTATSGGTPELNATRQTYKSHSTFCFVSACGLHFICVK